MPRPIAWVLAATMIVGLLGLTGRAEATREPAIEWSSGDHDIYQTCDKVSTSKPSLDRFNLPNRRSRSPESVEEPPGRLDSLIILLWFIWSGDLLIR
jgi:hypothetical protein